MNDVHLLTSESQAWLEVLELVGRHMCTMQKKQHTHAISKF